MGNHIRHRYEDALLRNDRKMFNTLRNSRNDKYYVKRSGYP